MVNAFLLTIEMRLFEQECLKLIYRVKQKCYDDPLNHLALYISSSIYVEPWS